MLLLAACGWACSAGEPASPSSWSRWLEVDGGTVHYLDTAGNLPALLIIPGYLGSTATFESLADRLSPRLRVIVPDLPGFGLSDAPSREASFEYYCGFVGEFAQEIGLQQFSLAGSSMGSLFVIPYAISKPQQVQRLVLISPFGMRNQAGRMPRIERYAPLLPLGVSLICRSMLRAQLRKQVYRAEALTEEMIDGYWQPFRTAAGRRVVVQVTRDIVGRRTFDDVLPLVGQPTLVVAGSKDSLVGPEVLALLGSRIPACKVKSLDDCSHLVYLDAPEPVAELIREFCLAEDP
jgi:pimeloyl-ACP methyl ester carboxylesterase